MKRDLKVKWKTCSSSKGLPVAKNCLRPASKHSDRKMHFCYLIVLLNNFSSFYLLSLRKKYPNTEFFLVRIFRHSVWIRRDTSNLSVFSPNAGKYGPEKTPYWDTFHAVFINKWRSSFFASTEECPVNLSVLELWWKFSKTPVQKFQLDWDWQIRIETNMFLKNIEYGMPSNFSRVQTPNSLVLQSSRVSVSVVSLSFQACIVQETWVQSWVQAPKCPESMHPESKRPSVQGPRVQSPNVQALSVPAPGITRPETKSPGSKQQTLR